MKHPTADEVTERLRRAADLSRDGAPHRGVDYSAAAITTRLRELAELSTLCARLGELGERARRR
jgi:hypothetical protein